MARSSPAQRAARPPAPTEKGEETRARVLAVAAKAFAESGYAGASLNDIIKATGLTKGGFYFHFPSKESLALEVVAFKSAEARADLLAMVEPHPRALDRLLVLLRGVCARYREDPDAKAVDRLCAEIGDEPGLLQRQ